MADIKLLGGMSISKGSLQYPMQNRTTEITMSGKRAVRNSQTIGFAAHEALYVGDLASAGSAMFVNLDTVNYVQIGIEVGGTFYPILDIGAGQVAGPIPRLSSLSLFAKANTAAVELDYLITER